MRIKLDPEELPVKVRARRYPAPQRAVLKAYIAKMVELGIFIPNPHVDGQAAPLMIPETVSNAVDLSPLTLAGVK